MKNIYRIGIFGTKKKQYYCQYKKPYLFGLFKKWVDIYYSWTNESVMYPPRPLTYDKLCDANKCIRNHNKTINGTVYDIKII